MSVQTQFHSWQSAPMRPDPRRCSPLLVTMDRHLRNRWGGAFLGCFAPRPVVGGSSPSSHASGAALDWRYANPGIGRTRMLNEVMPWLLDNSRTLGVQAVHDYVGSRIWRPPGTSGRPQGGVSAGWRQQSPGSQMGQSWALWIHIEVLNTRWSDARTIEAMLGAPAPAPTPPPQPEPEPEDDMACMLLQASNGTAEQRNAIFWWDGRFIGWVRNQPQRDVGVVTGVYKGNPSNGNRPFTNFNVTQIQQLINTAWSGGPVPAGFRGPPRAPAPAGLVP